MKILIANLNVKETERFSNNLLKERIQIYRFPIGLGIIANVLHRNGYLFEVYDGYLDGSDDSFLAYVNQNKPDVILLSGFLGNYMYRFLKMISSGIKEKSPLTKIIIGGPIASTIPHLLVGNSDIDVAVVGEGERTIIDLLEALDGSNNLSEVKGIHYRENGRVYFTGLRNRIVDLDSESCLPKYDAFNIDFYVKELKKQNRCWDISTSRGCYGSCAFCKLTFGSRITMHSNNYIIDHMREICERHEIHRFNFVDDNFLNSPGRANEFASLLKEQPYTFEWRFQGRADRLSREFVKQLKQVGMFDISCGLESGSPKMLKVYNKKLDLGKAFQNLKEVNDLIDVHATFIIGGPGETWDTINETRTFIENLKLRNATICILTPYPGTRLYEIARERGLITDEDAYCMSMGPIFDYPNINMSELTDEELLSARDMLQEAAEKFAV